MASTKFLVLNSILVLILIQALVLNIVDGKKKSKKDENMKSDDDLINGMEDDKEGVTGGPVGGIGDGLLSINLLNLDIDNKIGLYLYTRKNPKKGLWLHHWHKSKGFKKYWQKKENLTLIVHGWSGLAHKSYKQLLDIKNAYLKDKDREGNYIFVDWTDYSNNLVYLGSVKNTKKVGENLGNFTATLLKSKRVRHAEQIHCIGFHLGAHVCGIAGHKFEKLTEKKFGRITGLDPAGPSFEESKGRNERLEKTDADFVDVIHCSPSTVGTDVQAGHADFYPNGGTEQPGCHWDVSGACSHVTCPIYYSESIHKNFTACQCESYENYQAELCCKDGKDTMLMGHRCSPTAKGKYFLEAKVFNPYAKDENGEFYTKENWEDENKSFEKSGEKNGDGDADAEASGSGGDDDESGE